MFGDIAFSELLVVFIIALIVLGPERMPKAARALGKWVGKAKSGFNAIKEEIDRELQLQELQEQLQKQKADFEKQVEVESLKSTLSEGNQAMNQLTQDLQHPLESISTPTAKPQN